MINLSVNAINQRAPYKVEQTGDDSYSLLTESILVDNIRYYSSVLMRKDNPKLVQVLSSFTNFFKEHNEE